MVKSPTSFGGDVNGLAAGVHDAGQVLLRVARIGADGDDAGEQVARIEPAHRHDADVPAIVDVLDHEADLVHVRGEHDLGRVLALALADADEVAQGVLAGAVE
jgi:hypothetical protein